MNAFIKYVGKRIAADHKFKIVDESEYYKRIADAMANVLASHLYIANMMTLGIVEVIPETAEEAK